MKSCKIIVKYGNNGLNGNGNVCFNYNVISRLNCNARMVTAELLIS
jgi:hypothetical protein